MTATGMVINRIPTIVYQGQQVVDPDHCLVRAQVKLDLRDFSVTKPGYVPDEVALYVEVYPHGGDRSVFPMKAQMIPVQPSPLHTHTIEIGPLPIGQNWDILIHPVNATDDEGNPSFSGEGTFGMLVWGTTKAIIQRRAGPGGAVAKPKK